MKIKSTLFKVFLSLLIFSGILGMFISPVFAQETNYTYTNQEQDKSA